MILEGKDFYFKYEFFQIDLDFVCFFDLFVFIGKLMKSGEFEVLFIGLWLEYLIGVLLIDVFFNKFGKEDIFMFFFLQSKDYFYVFYDYFFVQKWAYICDFFYFEVNLFSFNYLDFYICEDV